eukprot:TRINITY_DN103111_c0_g1_i1.p1 TRINITY_DN103111_c0_g1~~TRINITY_DN103111_c0_g1_i1.p1  ORF type:complete len:337 (-),score=22.73 TRINITY_DN103111_c0_g1_i1:421-1431(-)
MGAHYSTLALVQWYREGSKEYGQKGFEQKRAKWDPKDIPESLVGKDFLVTGANAGIGYSIVEQLVARGGTVHMVCRNQTRGEEAKQKLASQYGEDKLHLHVCDMSLMSDVLKFGNDFLGSQDKLDAYIHNAGVMSAERTETSEGIETSVATMLGGSYLLTGMLVPLLKKNKGRVILMSSGGQYLVGLKPNDLQWKPGPKAKKFDGQVQYTYIKRAQVVLAELWAAKLEGTGVVVNSMHPGWSETPGVRSSIADFLEKNKDKFRDNAAAADTAVWLAASPSVEGQTGKFFFDREARKTHMSGARTKCKPEDEQTLWTETEKICGHRFDQSWQPVPLA